MTMLVRDFESDMWLEHGSLEASASLADSPIVIVVSRLDPAPDLVRASQALLSDEECHRASRFVFDRDRRRFVVARARLRQLLSARLKVRPESVALVYGAHGKPSLARRTGDPDIRFNVSHCEDIAVYAFAHGCEIGIDVEMVRAMRDADVVAARFFSRREKEAYVALEPRDKPLGFFNCWTRKEAFIKAVGDGLSHPLDDFDVSLNPEEPARILRVGSMHGERCGWRMDGFQPAAGHVGAVVTEHFIDS